jgi:hypothetical protein
MVNMKFCRAREPAEGRRDMVMGEAMDGIEATLVNVRGLTYMWRTMRPRFPFFGVFGAAILTFALSGFDAGYSQTTSEKRAGGAPRSAIPATTEDPGARPKQDQAAAAVNDLIAHWWVGDARTGHITPTHGGCRTAGRGVIWERAMMLCALEGLCENNGDPDLNARIGAQWRYDKAHYTAAELQGCGAGSINPWCDDACWSLLYYAIAFQQTGDSDALDDARGLIRKIHDRWHDDQLGGGLWYNDERKVKSGYSGFSVGFFKCFQCRGLRGALSI